MSERTREEIEGELEERVCELDDVEALTNELRDDAEGLEAQISKLQSELDELGDESEGE